MTRAGFGPRAAAFLIDRLLLVLALTSVRMPALLGALLGNGALTRSDFLFRYSALDVLCWLLSCVYFVLLTYFSGSTLGKKLMRLRVESADGTPLRFIDVLYRETIGRFLSGILCFGYFMVIVDKHKRGFHDWLCSTCVVYDGVRFREPRPAPAPAVPPAPPSPAAPVPAVPAAVPPVQPAAPVYSVPSEGGWSIPREVPAPPAPEQESEKE